MKVLLIRDVKSLGEAGEVKEVKDGYGQNFLIAKDFAKAAINEALRKYESDKKKEAEDLRLKLTNLEKLKNELSKIVLEISKPVGANGSLSDGATKEDITLALKEQKNTELGKESLERDTVKTLGTHTISAKLGYVIHVEFKIEVEAE